MSLIRTKQTWAADQIKTEVTTGEIKTVPNNAQSIREILFRNTNGMNYDNYKTPFYEDQADFSSESLNVIQDMELTEKMQYLDTVRAKALNLKNKIKGYQAEQEALAKAQIDAANQYKAEEEKEVK
jgi:hypothetical protein